MQQHPIYTHVKRRRVVVVAAVCGALVVIAVAVAVFVVPWPDPNHQTAVQVAQNAGVATKVTSGPQP